MSVARSQLSSPTENGQLTTVNPSYTGRLAPSPTGLLHLGHARTFWIAYQRAVQHNGTLWFRDEDLDAQRARPDYAQAMRDDLHWLGISWQHEARQSDRIPVYRAAMEQLLAAGLAYPCHCSRRDLQQSIAAPHEEETTNPQNDLADEPIYSGKCRPIPDLGGGPFIDSLIVDEWGTSTLQPNTNYRFRIPTTNPITFTDIHAGPQSFLPQTDFGDFLIWRKDDLPSYQLACVVDDAAMHITEVVRGRDLLKSTARQILLQRALGLPTPTYFHTDLLRDEQGIRLAKRHDALSLRSLRESGLSATEVLSKLKAENS